MKLYQVILIALFLMPIASAQFSVQLEIPGPDSNGYYSQDFQVNVTTSESPADVVVKLDDEVIFTDSGSDTYSVNIGTSSKEGTFSISVAASYASGNTTQNATSSQSGIRIDTIEPEINSDVTVDPSTVGLEQEFTIQVTVVEGFEVDFVRVGKQSDMQATQVNMTGADEDWSIDEITPDDFDCEVGTTCELRIEAFDEAGNSEFFDINIEVSDEYVRQNYSIDISSPKDDSLVRNSFLDFIVRLNATSVPPSSNRLCTYSVTDDETSALAEDWSGNTLAGTYFGHDFEGENIGDLLLESKLDLMPDGSYTLEMVCYDEDDNSYSSESNFIVLDKIPPDVFIDVTGLTNLSVNFTINGTEQFMVEDLEYKVFGSDEIFDVAIEEDYEDFYDDLRITGLEPDTEYIIQVKGKDRKDNDFTATEAFSTLEGDEEPEEVQEKTVEDITSKGTVKNISEDMLDGETYSHGIDWVREGDEVKVIITNFDLIIREVVITSREDLRNIKLDVSDSDTSPTWLTNNLPSESSVYHYIVFSAKNAPDDKIRYVKIRFEVSEIWLRDNGMTAEDIALYRRTGNEWNQLPTTLQRTGALLHRYEALSPGFSLFAIASKKETTKSVEEAVQEIEETIAEEPDEEEEVVADETEDEKMPWHWWAMLVLGFVLLVLVGYYILVSVRQRKREMTTDHKVVKSHMKRLEGFVDKAMEKGYSKEQIKKNLMKSGWDERLIAFVLRRR
ncbi:PGF-pre-PGF domain-containing protein [Nanoarchaeota archaeon]